MYHNTTLENAIQPSLIQENISLQDKNWFKTGGPARYYAEPKSTQEFQHLLFFAQQHHLFIFVLGEGANILISDNGFNGLVIRPQLNQIIIADQHQEEVYIQVGAGVNMHNLITHCLQNNIVGLEEFSGIPGTIGGSVYINLHYYEFLLSHFLLCADVIEQKTGNIQTVDSAWFNFGYNSSRLLTEDYYLLSATFKLKKVTDLEIAYARGRHAEIIRHRTNRYPKSNTCGSFFRNFYEHEVNLFSNNKKMIYIAYYLDKVGIKGNLRVGDAQVSYQHANMIVNLNNATTADIIGLARTMQELVQQHFNIIPQPECRLVGFDQYPLL